MSAPRKVALVTGATAGIGKASALALAKAGYDIVLAGRRLELLDAAAKECEAFGVKAIGVVTDVGNPDSVKGLFAKLKATFGRLDVLFNNAGIGAPAVPMDELSFEQWKAVVDTNLTGPFLCTQEAMRIMKAQTPQGGRIINNGSISAYAPRPFSAPYTATKHAISGLTRAANLDGRGMNIAVGQIDIGNVASDMTIKMANGVHQADGTIKPEARMEMSSVVDTFMTMASLPLSSNILFVTVMANQMPFVGRG